MYQRYRERRRRRRQYNSDEDARLDEAFVKYLSTPEPSFVDPKVVAAKREEWIKAWTEAVLR